MSNRDESATGFGLEQVCVVVELERTEVIQLVELGLVEPEGYAPDSWSFDEQMLALIQRARRLQRQLEVDWPGIALALQLLEQVEQLQSENRQLRQRLERFLS